MEKKERMEQIIARVAKELARTGETVTADRVLEALETLGRLPGLLALTSEHGGRCHKLLESSRIGERYRTCCALTQDYQVDPEQYDVVVLFNLTTEAMCRIASGITDTPYTKLAARALLSGKRLYVPREEVELYQYPAGEAGSYSCMMQGKLTKLVSWGLRICPMDQLEDRILEEASSAESGGCAAAEPCRAAGEARAAAGEGGPERVLEEKEITFSKRAITERDILEASRDHVKVIRITGRNILTALARDAVLSRNIRLVEE